MARVAFLAALLITQPAVAGDWFASADMRPTADWSGVYIGAFGGAGVSSGRARLHDYDGPLYIPLDVENGLFPRSIGHSRAGALVGVAAGANVQSGRFVGGVEADIGYSWSRLRHTFSRIDPGPFYPGVTTKTQYGTEFGAIGSLRARGGYAFGNTLLYGTAGIAAGHVRNRFSLDLVEVDYPFPEWSTSGVRFGYALGAGIEHKVTDNVSLKLESMYVDLADSVVTARDAGAFPGEHLSYRFSNDLVVSRVGFNVKF